MPQATAAPAETATLAATPVPQEAATLAATTTPTETVAPDATAWPPVTVLPAELAASEVTPTPTVATVDATAVSVVTAAPVTTVAATDEPAPAAVPVADLALRITIVAAGAVPGEATALIELINQGESDIAAVHLQIFMPAGVAIREGGWQPVAGQAAVERLAPGPKAGEVLQLPLALDWRQDAAAEPLQLLAEVTGLIAADGAPLVDRDSVADADPANGPLLDNAVDNELTGQGATDEDDHDEAWLVP